MRVGIVGAGGHGRDVREIVEARLWDLAGWYDDDPTRAPATPEDAVRDGIDLIIAVNDPRARANIADRLQRGGYPAVNWSAPPLVHPTAVLGRPVHVEPGCVLAAGVVLTTHVRLGAHTHVNVGASVSQGSTLGNFCTVGPGARICGDVTIGDEVFIGAGAVVANTARVEDRAIVGAGAVVLPGRVVREGETVVGVPAKPFSTRHGVAS